MKWKDIMRKAPNGVLAVCITVFACVVVLTLGAFAWKTGDATELRSLLNTLFNVATLILTGTSVVVAGSAARSSDQAAQQTNGALDGRIQEAVTRALESRYPSRVEVEGDSTT